MKRWKIWIPVLLICAGLGFGGIKFLKNQESEKLSSRILEVMESTNALENVSFQGFPLQQIEGIWCAGILEAKNQNIVLTSGETDSEEVSGTAVLESSQPVILKTDVSLALSIGDTFTLKNAYGQQQIYRIFGAEKCSEEDWKWISQEDFDAVLVSSSSAVNVYMAEKLDSVS